MWTSAKKFTFKIDIILSHLASADEKENKYNLYQYNNFIKTLTLFKNISNDENRLTRTNVQKIASLKDLFNSPINEVSFEVKSDDAYILEEKPDIVYMKNMLVNLYLNDGRIVTISSDEGTYNKVTYDCLFEKNVIATDGETKIFAENLDLLATKNTAEIYNNVRLNYPTGSLRSDKVNYNFTTKFFKVSMFEGEDKVVKMKVVQ